MKAEEVFSKIEKFLQSHNNELMERQPQDVPKEKEIIHFEKLVE